MTQLRRYSNIDDLFSDYVKYAPQSRYFYLLQIPNFFFDNKYAYVAEEGDKNWHRPGIIAPVAYASDPLLLTPFDSFHQESVSP